MLNKLFNYRLPSVNILFTRSIILQSDFELVNRMKLLNDNKKFKETLKLFDKQKKKNIDQFSSLILTQVLKACAGVGDLQRGSIIHRSISPRVKNDFYLLSILIHFYMQCGDVAQAESLFNTSTTKTLSIYGSMMKGYIKNNQTDKAIDIFKKIKNPDGVIITLLFNCCAHLKNNEALNLIKQVSSQIPKSFLLNSYVLTSLLDALMKCGDVAHAEALFDTLKEKSLPMYGAMMKGYIENNMENKAIKLFNQIKEPGEIVFTLLFNACAQAGTNEALNIAKQISSQIPKSFQLNSRLLTSLLDAIIKCDDIEYAQSLFDMSKNKTLSMYRVMVNGFLKENNSSRILDLFNHMKINNIQMDYTIWTCIIKALSQIGDYELSQSIVKQIPKSCFIDNQIHNALIDMWGKSGCVDQAKETFEKIVQPDQIGYVAMINSYGLNGMGIQAIELFHQMPKELINERTHICVLNACSHSGFVNEARSIFKNIPIKTERIYTTMVDCLSRSSFFEEAQQLIAEFEHEQPPSITTYMALLSGARNQNNSRLSQEIYNRMNKLFSRSNDSLTPASTLLANVYGAIGDTDKASDIRIQLIKSGAKKKIGLTLNVTNGQLYKFQAHDQSHSRSSEIYAEAEKISKELLEHGHQYDSSWITRPLNQDETVESVLCGHSERLAIAWNFVANPNTSRIQLTKNLRVCGDCHRATKLIAYIRQCEIIVRDANRIHHFHKNGQCSCNDYF